MSDKYYDNANMLALNYLITSLEIIKPMLEKAVITFLFYISSIYLFAQQRDVNSLQITCSETKLKSNGVSFKLILANKTTDTFSIPKRIRSGPINYHINLGYEILYINECGDTSDLTENLYADIHYATTISWNTIPQHRNPNIHNLLPGGEKAIELSIDDYLLDKKGNYLIRFSIKKEMLFHNGSNFADDLKSDWIKVYKAKDNPPRGSKAYLNSQPVSSISVQ